MDNTHHGITRTGTWYIVVLYLYIISSTFLDSVLSHPLIVYSLKIRVDIFVGIILSQRTVLLSLAIYRRASYKYNTHFCILVWRKNIITSILLPGTCTTCNPIYISVADDSFSIPPFRNRLYYFSNFIILNKLQSNGIFCIILVIARSRGGNGNNQPQHRFILPFFNFLHSIGKNDASIRFLIVFEL